MIESAYKQTYLSDILEDCQKMNYTRIINRIMSVPSDTKYGEILSLRVGELSDFEHIKDEQMRKDYSKAAKAYLTNFRRKLKKEKNVNYTNNQIKTQLFAQLGISGKVGD